MSNLTLYEREKIEYLLRCRLKVRAIARLVGRDHSVISREIRRNKGQYFPYSASVANRAAQRKAKLTNKRKLDKDPRLRAYVIACLQAGWSPQQIAGRLKHRPPVEFKDKYISHEQIYEYIYTGQTDNQGKRLHHHLRRSQPTRQKHYSRKIRVCIPERVSIHVRPEVVNTKERFGDWETDTVCFGRQREALSVQYERKSQLVRLNKLPNHSAQATTEALIKTLENLPRELVQTVSFDNGSENFQHIELKDIFDIQTYFCDPYASWQKGGVENINGLIRQYLPKKTDITQITNEVIETIQNKLNSRPRKTHTYLTPLEVLEEYQEKQQVVH